MRYIQLLGVSLFMASAGITTAAPHPSNHPGRVLASNCFQCHGMNGYSESNIDSLAGERDIYAELQEMRLEAADTDIMNVHAQAYTDAELRIIADFFASLPYAGDDDDDYDDDDFDDDGYEGDDD